MEPQNSLFWGLETAPQMGYNKGKIGKNVLIHYARYYNIGDFLSRTGRKSEGKKGVSGGCGNVVNPIGFSIISMAGARGERGR